MSPFAAFALLTFAVSAVFYAYHKLVSSKYWAKRNIPHLDPVFFLGNIWKVNITENISEKLTAMYLEHKEKKVLGFWSFNTPQLLVFDLDIVKRILIRDFNSFRDRGLDVNEEKDPLAAHLFLLSGKRWRNLRVKLTPTFTSGKMKLMYPTMTKCGTELQTHLRAAAERKETVEVKDLMARYTTDIISSCAFGIETNSLKNPDSEFRKYGKMVFHVDLRTILINVVMVAFPKIFKLLQLRLINKDITDFFMNAVRETIEFREKNNVTRNDFLQLLIQLIRSGKVEDADRNTVNADGMDDEALVQKFSLREAAAQCFVFFAAGFETSSTALTFALYELALHPDIQARLQKEIDENVGEGEVSYDTMISMEYLDGVVQETLRKYPPVGMLQRISNAEYHIPEVNGTLDKGTMVILPVRGYHYDPNLYPDPERFDPERFTEDNKNQRDGAAFLPFGDGPRNCIGNRFGLMQVKTGLIKILQKYNVEMAKTTPVPVKYDITSFIPSPKGGMPLMFTKRN